MECCKSIPELGVHMENGINVDPKPLSKDEFAIAGVPLNGKASQRMAGASSLLRIEFVSYSIVVHYCCVACTTIQESAHTCSWASGCRRPEQASGLAASRI